MADVRLSPSIHVPFVLTSFVIAVFGGFAIAIELPLLAALSIANPSWVAQAQVHGHLQSIGFVGLFIVGVSYHLVPGFTGGRSLPHPRLVTPSLWLIAGGVLLRAVGQLAAPHLVPGVMLVIGAWAEAAGALCAAANIVPGMWGAAHRSDPTAPFFISGATWFTAQSILGGWWLTQMAIRGDSVLPPNQDGVLTLLQLVGFHLMFVLGVGVRSFPVFFASPRLTLRAIAIPCAIVQAGVAALLVRSVEAIGPILSARVEGAGLALVGSGVLWLSILFGWWRPPTRVRPASRAFAFTLQLALVWLTVIGVGAVVEGFGALLNGVSTPWAIFDAGRHLIAIGVVLTLMIAMAQLILPEFASERFEGRQSSWRGIALGVSLFVATALRAGARLLENWLPASASYWSMTIGGTIAVSVVIMFALLFLRGMKKHRELLARFASMAAAGELLPLKVADER